MHLWREPGRYVAAEATPLCRLLAGWRECFCERGEGRERYGRIADRDGGLEDVCEEEAEDD